MYSPGTAPESRPRPHGRTEGAEHARRLGLTVTGTLGVLDRAAERGLMELAPAIARLRQSNFRVDPSLLDRLLAADARQRVK